MPDRDTSAGQPGTYSGPGLRGPDLDTVLGRSKSLDEILAPMAAVSLVIVGVMLLVAFNRDARRLWAILTWGVYFIGLYFTGYILRTILLIWRIR